MSQESLSPRIDSYSRPTLDALEFGGKFCTKENKYRYTQKMKQKIHNVPHMLDFLRTKSGLSDNRLRTEYDIDVEKTELANIRERSRKLVCD